jgi:hypothetical protein
MTAFFQQQQATSKYSIGALLTSDNILAAIKKELRKISPTVKVEDDFLRHLLINDVLKRELIEGDEATAASELIKKALKAQAKLKAKAATISN